MQSGPHPEGIEIFVVLPLQTALASEGGRHKPQSSKFSAIRERTESWKCSLELLDSHDRNDSHRTHDIARRVHSGSTGLDLIWERITDAKIRAAEEPGWMDLKKQEDESSKGADCSGSQSHIIRTAWMRRSSSEMHDTLARPPTHSRSKKTLSAERCK